jgi:hypothetical protein
MNLHALVRRVCESAGLKLSTPIVPEIESADYAACRFEVDAKRVVFRLAKTTPSKVGQFVTLWKRPQRSGEIAPMDANDPVDFVVVHSSNTERCGHFVFDKNVLIKMGVLSSQQHAGKRAIRVYPPWSHPVAKDAVKTQSWQLPYFIELGEDGSVNRAHARKLFACDHVSQ